MVLWRNRQFTLVREGRQAVVNMFNLTYSERRSALTICRSLCYLRGGLTQRHKETKGLSRLTANLTEEAKWQIN